MPTYAELLRDPRWQKKRLEIFDRDEWACKDCGETEKTLHVHHTRYAYGKPPWDAHDHWMVTLCEDCHAVATASGKRLKEVITWLSPSDMERVIGYISAVSGWPAGLVFANVDAEYCHGVADAMKVTPDEIIDIAMATGSGPMDLDEIEKTGAHRLVAVRNSYLAGRDK